MVTTRGIRERRGLETGAGRLGPTLPKTTALLRPTLGRDGVNNVRS